MAETRAARQSGTVGRPGTDHVVVMGAGPAGLSAALELTRQGTPVTVLEKEPMLVGGISRTLEFMGCRFDFGPQRFSSKSDEAEALWSDLLGEEIHPVRGLSRMLYKGKFFLDPIRASNVFLNLGPVETARCLTSYARVRLRPVDEPRSFEDWVSNRIGERLFSIFFKSYTEKLWGVSARELSADRAGDRIEGLKLLEVTHHALRPALRGRGAGDDLSVGVDSFRYPRLGAGQIWEAVARQLQASGQPVRMGEEVVAVRHSGGRVIAATVRNGAGRPVEVIGSQFISMVPIPELIAKLVPAAPSMVRAAAEALTYRDVITMNLVLDKGEVFPDEWISVHDPAVRVARISNFKNSSLAMVADPGLSGLGLEYFCFETDQLWGMADAELLDLGRRELVALGICEPDDVKAGMVNRQSKMYPTPDQLHEDNLALIRKWLRRALPNLWLVGENEMVDYHDQDRSMMSGVLLARKIRPGVDDDQWGAKGGASYPEGELVGNGAGPLSGRQVAS